jgi:hypothetical protein
MLLERFHQQLGSQAALGESQLQHAQTSTKFSGAAGRYF